MTRRFLGLMLPTVALAVAVGTESARAQLPFDFSDQWYEDNGIDASLLDSRVDPSGDIAVWDFSGDPRLRNVRITLTNLGFDAAGQPLYYPQPPANVFEETFLDNEAGQKAKEIANEFRAFIFPLRDGDPLGPPVPNRRQDNVFDTSSGYLTENPLGLWRVTFPRYTDAALNTPEGQAKMAELIERNGVDKDGTAIIKRLSEINELEELGYLELLQRAEDGSQGFPWVV